MAEKLDFPLKCVVKKKMENLNAFLSPLPLSMLLVVSLNVITRSIDKGGGEGERAVDVY